MLLAVTIAFAAVAVAVGLAGCGHSQAGARDWVVFASDRDGRWDVYAVHPDGRGLIRVSARRDQMAPPLAASPDGSKLAIVNSGGTTVIDASGRRTHRSGGDMYAQPQVTNDGKVHLAAGDLAWRSADGAHLAHVDRRGRLSIRTKGGAVRKVARGVEPAQLSWSPNSVLLAFPLARGAHGPHAPIYQVAVVDADGSGLRVLTRSRGNEEEAYPNAWSPDGRRLLFVRGYAPAALDQVWSTAPDGSDARALTRAYPAGGENASPVWFRGKLTSVRSPPPRVRTIGRALRTRYLVGEVEAAAGRVAVLPLPHDPQTPRPTFPFLVWTPATAATASWPIPACAQPEGLLFDGGTATFDCNNSCCDSSDESLLVFRAGAPPLEVGSGEGSAGEGGSFLRGYALDDGRVSYGRSLERQGKLERVDLWLFERGRRRRLGALGGDVVGYASGRIAILRRGQLEVVDKTGRELYSLALPRLRAVPESGHFHSPSAPIRLGRELGVALQDGRLIVWDARSGRARRSWPFPEKGALLDDLSGHRAALIVGKAVWVVDLDSGRPAVYHFPAAVIGRLGHGTVGFYAKTPVRAGLDGNRLVVAYNVAQRSAEPGRVVVIKLAPTR